MAYGGRRSSCSTIMPAFGAGTSLDEGDQVRCVDGAAARLGGLDELDGPCRCQRGWSCGAQVRRAGRVLNRSGLDLEAEQRGYLLQAAMGDVPRVLAAGAAHDNARRWPSENLLQVAQRRDMERVHVPIAPVRLQKHESLLAHRFRPLTLSRTSARRYPTGRPSRPW